MREEVFEKFKNSQRTVGVAQTGDKELGPLRLLPGTWESTGKGWNMIALPFAAGGGLPNYRLLLNQYNETLVFFTADKRVPNRGIFRNGISFQTDQFLAALSYVQNIDQIAAADRPESGEAGDPKPIHHEPGLWLHMANETTGGLDLARLATIPHGDSVLALGRSTTFEGPPTFPSISGLPIGVDQSLQNPYLAPYLFFHRNRFQGVFDPVVPNDLLNRGLDGIDIKCTTVLSVDSTLETGGIVNIPFIVRQANAAEMTSTFWIEELEEKDDQGRPVLQLQYSQVVLLDFFPRTDGQPGLVRWPHVSINTLRKTKTEGYADGY